VSAPSVEAFQREARAWLESELPRRTDDVAVEWGQGPDAVPLFHSLSAEDERALVDALRAWHQRKADAGFNAIDWAEEFGGRGLTVDHARAFAREERDFVTPAGHESVGITRELVAPTIRAWGTADQQARFLRPMLRTDEMWCQLYSEPSAGSDLAGVATRAERDGDQWVITGQKVWTSGAQYADWGYVLCRTDPDVPKHRGLTAFIVPMRAAGVEVRPLRQMTGGASFNEVFFDGLRVGDEALLGDVGGGWRVAMTTLGFERVAGSGEGGDLLRRWRRLVAVARHRGRARDPVLRQRLAALYTHARAQEFTLARVSQALETGATPGPESSIGKLFASEGLQLVTEVASLLLGPSLAANTGEWGTFAWGEHITGLPGSRIAGGTDEVQRNIIGERVLGLPGEPRVDRDVPFAEVPR
jgi:alkylation response protein AidB-like acyl-CoA dehydrogenase